MDSSIIPVETGISRRKRLLPSKKVGGRLGRPSLTFWAVDNNLHLPNFLPRRMSYFVYVLFSKRDKGIYIGCTSNLKRRLKEHFNGKVYSTHNRYPLSLIYYEFYLDADDAYQREKFLKTGWGRNYLKKALKNFRGKKLGR